MDYDGATSAEDAEREDKFYTPFTSIHDLSTSPCVANVSLKGAFDELIPPIRKGKLQITIMKIKEVNGANRPFVRITLSDQCFQTSISSFSDGRWYEGFELDVSYHTQLFGTIQLDVLDSRFLLPDRHIGRVEIRLSDLRGLPDHFTSWYELWDKQLSGNNLSLAASKRHMSDNLGAIQAKIAYKYQYHTGKKASYSRRKELDNESTHTKNQLKSTTTRSLDDIESDASEANRPSSPTSSYFSEAAAVPPQSNQWLINNFSNSLEQDYKNSFISEEEDMFISTSQEEKSTFLGKLGEYMISDETLKAITAIKRLMAAFGQGLEVSNLDFIKGLIILEKYYNSFEMETNGETLSDLRDIELPMHYYKYSMAAYGWRGLNFFGKGKGIIVDSVRTKADEKCVREYLSLPKEDLLVLEFSSKEIFRPSYFIAVDRPTNSIVLSIRGTMSARDTLTDLVCEYEPWKDGVIHTGIKTAALWFMRNVVPQLIDFFQNHDISDLVIVGHSLGAGTASVLTMMLKDYIEDRPGLFKIQCFAYAPPPVVSLDLAKKYVDCIESYILECDLVCRLSYGSVVDFKSMAICAAEYAKTTDLWSLGSLMLSSPGDPSALGNALIEALNECREAIKNSGSKNPKLYVPGKVFHMRSVPTFQNPTRTLLERSHQENFVEIIIKKSMLLDHLPSIYDRSFHRAFETMMIERDIGIRRSKRKAKSKLNASVNQDPENNKKTVNGNFGKVFENDAENEVTTQHKDFASSTSVTESPPKNDTTTNT